MGAHGFRGLQGLHPNASSVFNYNMSDFLYGHSEFFTEENLDWWGAWFIAQLTSTSSYFHRTVLFDKQCDKVDALLADRDLGSMGYVEEHY